MNIVIAVILLILVFENTMIMFMLATIASDNKENAIEKIKDEEKEKLINDYLRDKEQEKFKQFAEYMMKDYDKYEANKNFVGNSHSDK